MIELINLQHWVEQLQSQCPLYENRVYQSIDDDSMDVIHDAMPMALICIDTDNSTESQTTVLHSQQINSRIKIKTHVRYTVTATEKYAQSAVDQVWEIRNQLLTALMGWTPPDSNDTVNHAGMTQNINYKDKIIRITDIFTINHNVSQPCH